MSAERGWIGEPQPKRQWRSSHCSRMADKFYEAQQQRLREAERQALTADLRQANQRVAEHEAHE